MSYILDALRRADAERSRGAVPGLHSQSLPGDDEPAARDRRPLIWAAGASGVLVVAGLVIVLFGPWHSAPAPDTRASLAPAPELAPVPRDGAPAQPAQFEPPAQPPGALDPGARPIEPPLGRNAAPPQAYPPLPQPRRVERPVSPSRVATLEPRAEARPPAIAATPAPVEHYGAPIPSTSPSAPAHGSTVTSINDLPPNVRSTLPHLAVGGAIYSDTPSARMVILNGQVFHEGDKPAADTVLEQIRLKSAVLNFRGQRYEVSF